MGGRLTYVNLPKRLTNLTNLCQSPLARVRCTYVKA